MEFSDFSTRKKEIYGKADIEYTELCKQYALEHNKYPLGSRFTDHIGTIEVTGIGVTVDKGVPTCVYAGKIILKNGQYSKKDERRQAWQINDVNVPTE